MDKFDQLRAITRKALSDSEGCEWVKSKSIQDIGTYTLEEIYELLDAIENKDGDAIKDELADLAFHLVLYAEMSEQQGSFSLEDILEAALEKQRHRRLSLENSAASEKEAHAHWVSQKQKARGDAESVLADIPINMPALVRSKKIQDCAGEVGFDWDNLEDILLKLNEEIDEFKVEYEGRNQEAMLDELGDMLFTLVNIGRHLGIDAEQALRCSNAKFSKRFIQVEKIVKERGQRLDSVGFKALLEVWEAVKKSENRL